jgi:hypothetical protein
MISDFKITALNKKGYSVNFLNNQNNLQFDLFVKNLSVTDDYKALPENVKIVLESTGVFSLIPDKSWIKTVLTSENLIKAFKGSTIYTPPPETIGFFINLRNAQSKQNQFAKFLSNLFA